MEAGHLINTGGTQVTCPDPAAAVEWMTRIGVIH
jgi:hypothetical protein